MLISQVKNVGWSSNVKGQITKVRGQTWKFSVHRSNPSLSFSLFCSPSPLKIAIFKKLRHLCCTRFIWKQRVGRRELAQICETGSGKSSVIIIKVKRRAFPWRQVRASGCWRNGGTTRLFSPRWAAVHPVPVLDNPTPEYNG